MKADSAQRELVKILRGEIMPLARAGALRPVLTVPPIEAPPGVTVTARSAPALPLSPQHRFSRSNTKWPARGLHSSRYPILGCIFQGEADFVIGVTEALLAASAALNPDYGEYVLALPKGSVFIIPPETPYSDGSRLHWERPHPENASSRIFWIQLLPLGAVVHACHTAGGSHAHTSAALVRDARLAVFGQFLIESSGGLPLTGEIAHTCLFALLLCLEQSLSGPTASATGEGSLGFLALSEREEPHGTPPDETDTDIVERACRYIRLHLSDALSLAQIAQGCYVSVPRLKRLFRAELDTPVMKYVTHCRMEEAKILLEGTALATQEIGRICGYIHRPHFSRLFTAWAGVSPEAYRRQMRGQAAAKQPAGRKMRQK